MATRETIPHNPHNSQFQRGVFANKSGAAKYYRQFIKPWEFFPQQGTPAVADLNSTFKVEGVQSITAGDSASTLQPIPDVYDRSQDVYIRVIFANTTTADKNPTWLIKYFPMQDGDTYATAPNNTALDDAITVTTDTTAAVNTVRTTVYGRIAAGAFDDEDFMIGIDVECDANDTVTTWYLIGVEVLWARKSL